MCKRPLEVEDVLTRVIVANGASVVTALQEIQNNYGYLPEEVLRAFSRKTGIPMVDIFNTATFYNAFSLEPRGRHQITVCVGTTCHIRGAGMLIEAVSRLLEIQPGEVTPDREFSLETVNCLGCCAFAPVMVLDGKYYGNLTAGKAREIVGRIREEAAEGAPEADEGESGGSREGVC